MALATTKAEEMRSSKDAIAGLVDTAATTTGQGRVTAREATIASFARLRAPPRLPHQLWPYQQGAAKAA